MRLFGGPGLCDGRVPPLRGSQGGPAARAAALPVRPQHGRHGRHCRRHQELRLLRRSSAGGHTTLTFYKFHITILLLYMTTFFILCRDLS